MLLRLLTKSTSGLLVSVVASTDANEAAGRPDGVGDADGDDYLMVLNRRHPGTAPWTPTFSKAAPNYVAREL